jgi:hypothetical protein
MVGQLVSLNQLDQLISINSILSGLGNPTTSTSTAVQGTTASPQGIPGVSGGPGSTSSNPISNAAAEAALKRPQTTNTQPAATNSLMNLYGNMGAPAQTPTF